MPTFLVTCPSSPLSLYSACSHRPSFCYRPSSQHCALCPRKPLPHHKWARPWVFNPQLPLTSMTEIKSDLPQMGCFFPKHFSHNQGNNRGKWKQSLTSYALLFTLLQKTVLFWGLLSLEANHLPHQSLLLTDPWSVYPSSSRTSVPGSVISFSLLSHPLLVFHVCFGGPSTIRR